MTADVGSVLRRRSIRIAGVLGLALYLAIAVAMLQTEVETKKAEAQWWRVRYQVYAKHHGPVDVRETGKVSARRELAPAR